MVKLPSSAPEVEVLVLAAAMNERSAIAMVGDFITENSFTIEKHRLIWSAISELSAKNEPIDIFLVAEELKKQGKLKQAGGAGYLSEVGNKISSSANIEAHAKILKQCEIKRFGHDVGREMIDKSTDETVDSLQYIDECTTKLFDLQQLAAISRPKDNRAIIQVIRDRVESLSSEVTGIPTGLKELDSTYHGWQNQDLIIIAGRPAMGKSGLAVTLADNACNNGYKCLFFSLEMSAMQIVSRRLARLSGVPSGLINAGKVDEKGIKALQEPFEKIADDKSFRVDDQGGVTITEICSKAKREKIEHDIDLVIIDYLQLVNDPTVGGNREQEVGSISRKLKALAKSLDIPVIALSQLSRSVESRADRRPMLSDLRESGAIEQDADAVIFTYRPEYYGMEVDSGMEGGALLIVAKYRNFYTGEYLVKYVKPSTHFEDFENKPIHTDPDRWISTEGMDENPF